jgi:zinc protease
MKSDLKITVLAILTTALLFVKVAFALEVPVTEFQLANGLRVVVIEDHRAPVVMHAVVYDVGGADEVTGKTGLAHFFEHLMFKGTTKYPQGQFDALLDENGVEHNAFTSLDNTVYYERASPALLELLMDLESDRMQNLVLTLEILKSERKVVQEERRQRTDSDPYGNAVEKLNMKMFKLHPYGRPIIGWAEDVAKLTLDDAITFYRRHYMPAKALVLVVGDVVPADVKKLAEQYYGPLKNPAFVEQFQRPEEPPRQTAERLDLEDPRIAEAWLLRMYQLGSNRTVTPKDAAAFDVLAHILGSDSQSRLTKQLVTSEAVATSVSAHYGGSIGDYGQFHVSASPRSQVAIEELEKRVDWVLRDIVEKGVSPEELQDTKNAVEAYNIYQRDNPVSLALTIATAMSNGKTSNYLDIVNAQITELTPADIQNAAKSVLNINTSVTLILRPKK